MNKNNNNPYRQHISGLFLYFSSSLSTLVFLALVCIFALGIFHLPPDTLYPVLGISIFASVWSLGQAFFLEILPFCKKLHLEESITLADTSFTVHQKNKEVVIPYSIVTTIDFDDYVNDSYHKFYLMVSLLKMVGIFRIKTSNKGDFFLPPSYEKRDEILKTIIEKARLEKTPPISPYKFKIVLFGWQDHASLFYSWHRTDKPFKPENLIINVRDETVSTTFLIVVLFTIIGVALVYFGLQSFFLLTHR